MQNCCGGWTFLLLELLIPILISKVSNYSTHSKFLIDKNKSRGKLFVYQVQQWGQGEVVTLLLKNIMLWVGNLVTSDQKEMSSIQKYMMTPSFDDRMAVSIIQKRMTPF
jgi:hypothetical protein